MLVIGAGAFPQDEVHKIVEDHKKKCHALEHRYSSKCQTQNVSNVQLYLNVLIMWYRYENQIFQYTRCITPKRETNLQSLSRRHCARATQLPSEKCWRVVGNTVFDLTSLDLYLKTSQSRDKRVNARTTGRD